MLSHPGKLYTTWCRWQSISINTRCLIYRSQERQLYTVIYIHLRFWRVTVHQKSWFRAWWLIASWIGPGVTAERKPCSVPRTIRLMTYVWWRMCDDACLPVIMSRTHAYTGPSENPTYCTYHMQIWIFFSPYSFQLFIVYFYFVSVIWG